MPIEPKPTSYSIMDFLEWQRDGTLELQPPFQRKAVWRPILKSSLIDSILRGYPIPALFLQDRSDSRTFKRRLVVVDGQQRLRTVLSYVDASCLPDRDERDEFSLLKIHDPARAGQTFQDLTEQDRDQIASTRFNVYLVGSSVSDAELLEIFRRMNTYGAQLNAQELRNARFGGYFKEVAYGLASEFLDQWLGWGMLNRQQVAEMRDAEFVSDLMLLSLDGVQASTRKSLDDAYKDYEDEFSDAADSQDRVRALILELDRLFAKRQGVERLTTRMWVYSLADAIQRVRFGGSLRSADSSRRSLSLTKLRGAATKVNQAIQADRLPEAVARATRGAANDRKSRDARAKFIVSKLRST